MIADQRRRRLVELVGRRGFASLAELAEQVGASESTVRRDLEALDQAGVLRRTHGGAMMASDVVSIPAFEDRGRVAAAEKRKIGITAARLIADGDTVLLDGGTTTFEVARNLVGRSVQVVSNSVPIANLLAGDRQVELTLVGGYVYPRTGVAVGPLANQFLANVNAQWLIMSVAGITERGFFNSNGLLVETELHMMRAVREVVVVADHSKFGEPSLAFLCALEQAHRLVTDGGVDEQYRQMVLDRGLELVVAEEESP